MQWPVDLEQSPVIGNDGTVMAMSSKSQASRNDKMAENMRRLWLSKEPRGEEQPKAAWRQTGYLLNSEKSEN